MYPIHQWPEYSQPLAERPKLHERAIKWLGGLVHRGTANRADRTTEKNVVAPWIAALANDLDGAIWSAGRRFQAAERSWQFSRYDPNRFDPDVLKPWESLPSQADLDTTALRSELWLAQKAKRAVEQGRGYHNKWVGQWLDHQMKAAERDLRALDNVLANPRELRAAAEAHGVNPMYTDYEDRYAEYATGLRMQGSELMDSIAHYEIQQKFNEPVAPSLR